MARIPSKFGFGRMDGIQVLSPMQKGALGCRNFNDVLQKALNPSGPAVERFGWTCRVGDKVMQMVKDYDKDVFNGDIGRVAAIDEVEHEMTVRSDGRLVKCDFNELDDLHLSYPTDPQEQGLRVPRGRHAGPHPALHHAPAQPALHGRHPRAEAGGAGGDAAGVGDRGQEHGSTSKDAVPC